MNPHALHKLGYGVYVVTSRKGDRLNGQICNTVFQVTSEPPTVGVSINKDNLTWEFIQNSRVFAVSVLCQDTPLSFIGGFGFKSGRDTDKLAGVGHRIGVTGAPVVLDSAVAFLEAEVIGELSVGTHTIFVGRIVEGDVLNDRVCMTYDYYHQVKQGTTPKAAPTYTDPRAGASAASG